MKQYISYWCFGCRFDYYKGKFEVSENYVPNYDSNLKLCVRCRKRHATRRSVIIPAFSTLYISKHDIYTWLGFPMTLWAMIKLFIIQITPNKLPPVNKILKKTKLYNRLFLDFIKNLDRAYQLRNEGNAMNLSVVDGLFDYWTLNYNKLKTTINSARIILENPPRKTISPDEIKDFRITDFENKVKELDSFLNDYSKIKIAFDA